mgnify:CR=1 FL=1
MLNAAITTQHVVYPTLDMTSFFEYVLKNPYNTEQTINIDCDRAFVSFLSLSDLTQKSKWIYLSISDVDM